MASVYVRRFPYDPGTAILLNIESVNILDLTPPASIQGVGTGNVLLVAEMENGPFTKIQAVLSSTDLMNTWGTLGYVENGQICKYPSSVQRFPDSAITGEFWNGNGFLALNGKQFASLSICRVDTSVGSVQFTSLAYVTGNNLFSYPLVSGNTLVLEVDAIAVTSTFTGVAATVTGSEGTFPTTFTGGQTLVLSYDGNPNFTVYFQASDQSNTQVCARINQYAGFTFATVSGGQIKLTGLIQGTSGRVGIVSGSSGVLSDLGLMAAVTDGTGNVANIAAVQFSEIQSIVQTAAVTASTTVSVQQDQSNALRISNTFTSAMGTISVTSCSATNLGFVAAQAGNAAVIAGGTLPAGTIVQDTGATNVLVTMQDVTILPNNAGPYSVKVRYAVDTNVQGGNGTGAGTTAGAITVVLYAPPNGSFSVINPQPITPALTENQIDAAYVNALASTTDINTIAKTINIVWCARHSNTVRRATIANAIYASDNGCYGRFACISPPLNTLPQTALSNSADPGVGAYRSQHAAYCYIGANVYVPLIGQVGTAGGLGFTANGQINQTSDGWMACILSQLAPEENPGQETPFTGAITSIETGPNVQNFDINDYIAFKAAGIAALRFDTDNGLAIFQSGATSVNPLTQPSLVRISRQRMADYIEDSIAIFSTGFGKKLNTRVRRNALANEITAFLSKLLGLHQPGSQRINGYDLDRTGGNTPELLQQGLYRILINVQTLVSLDSIVFQCTIGDQVTVTQVLPANS